MDIFANLSQDDEKELFGANIVNELNAQEIAESFDGCAQIHCKAEDDDDDDDDDSGDSG